MWNDVSRSFRSPIPSAVRPFARFRLLSPGPSGEKARCETPRNPGSFPMLMPRKLTNGGTSDCPLRSLDTTDPNDGCWPWTAARFTCSVYPVMTYESLCSSLATSERTTDSLSIIFACIGKCSQMSMPGTFVLIGLNSPRNSAGASGLRSYMSMCDGPPGR